MVLRLVHAAVPREKKKDHGNSVSTTRAPAVRSFPGCGFLYAAKGVEKGHEGAVISVSGGDSHDSFDGLEAADLSQGAARTVTTSYTRESSGGAPPLHGEAFAQRP